MKTLHYQGDVTNSLPENNLLGYPNRVAHAYEIVDATYDASTDRTTIRLAAASEETIEKATAAWEAKAPVRESHARFAALFQAGGAG